MTYTDGLPASIHILNENDIDGLDCQKIGVPGSGTIVPKIYPPVLPEPGRMIHTGSVRSDVSSLIGILTEKGVV